MVDFDINIVMKKLNQVETLIKGLNSATAHAKKTEQAITTMSTATDKVIKKQKDLGKQFKNNQDDFKTLVSGTFLESLVNYKDRLTEINKAWSRMGRGKGFAQNIQDLMSGISKKASSVTSIFTDMGKTLFSKGPMIIANVFKSAIPFITSLAVKLLPITAIFAGITAAVLTLKRMWKLNIGGMQTTFHKMFGKIKDIWGRFMITFDKSLRKLDVPVRIFVGYFEKLLLPVLYAVQGAFEGIFFGVEPLLDAIGEAFKPLEEMLNIGGKNKEFLSFLNIIRMTFKSIGWSIRVALTPLTFFLKIIKQIFEGVSKLVKPFNDAFKPIEKLMNGINNVKDFFNKDDNEERKETTVKRGESIRRLQTVNATNQNVVNNNQQVTNNLSSTLTKDNFSLFTNRIAGQLMSMSRL